MCLFDTSNPMSVHPSMGCVLGLVFTNNVLCMFCITMIVRTNRLIAFAKARLVTVIPAT